MLRLTVGNVERCAPDKNRIRVVCNETCIHYVISGAGYYNGVRVCSGDAFIVYKNCYMDYYPDVCDPWTYVWYRLSGTDDEGLLKKCGLPEKSGLFGFDYAEMLLNTATAIFTNGDELYGNRSYAEASAKLLLSLNCKDKEDYTPSAQKRWVELAKNYIDMNYHEKIKIEDIARRLHIDRKYLRNLFIKYEGISTMDYLMQKRMQRARELLSEGVPVGVCAGSVGYTDPLGFSSAFKRYFGKSPSNYSPD